jgi:hypothetical protein
LDKLVTDEVKDGDGLLNNSMNMGIVLVAFIMYSSLFLEYFSIKIAVILSLAVWLVFADVLSTVGNKLRTKVKLLETKGSLHRFCVACGIRFSLEKHECPKCGKYNK